MKFTSASVDTIMEYVGTNIQEIIVTKREELDKIMSEQTADVPKITKALADWIVSQELSVGQAIIALSATTSQILSTLPDDFRREMMYKIFMYISATCAGKKV